MHRQDSESEIVKSARKIQYMYYFEFNLTTAQRTIFALTVSALLIFSLIGNFATLVVALRNGKVRPLFRSCLISLALSDILFSLSSSAAYLTAFFSATPQLWALGYHLCHIIPFSKVLGNLVNSSTLLTISVDRYLSVRCITRGLWEPGAKFCVFLLLLIWITSTAISIPTFLAYTYYPVFIVKTPASPNGTDATSMIPGHMCGAPKTVNARYYTSLFCILFFPMIAAFVWFNAFLAIDIWKRRNIFVSHASDQTESERNNNQDNSSGAPYQSRPKSTTSGSNSRLDERTSYHQRRQMRMFCVVLLLIITYMVLKLPEWIFLIISFYDDSVSDNPWIEQFAFGIISMGSSVTNPLLYAFVTQTMEYLQDLYCTVRKFCWFNCKRGVRVISNFPILTKETSSCSNMYIDNGVLNI